MAPRPTVGQALLGLRGETMRKPVIAMLLSAVLLLMWAAPVAAGPPERADEPVFFTVADEEHRLGVWLNITRDDFCDWEAGGFQGPPPVDRLLTVQSKETGQGAIVWSLRSSVVPIELWRLDDDVPPLEGPCVDTDDQEGPWATGTARIGGNDNDVLVSQTRTNSFGARFQAAVTDDDGGTWRYSFAARLQITKDGDFHSRAEHFNLARTGR